MSSALSFTVEATDGAARTGLLQTPRGAVRTPAFMPVGTAATVKAMHPEAVKATGADIILGNTYHLMLRPGEELIRDLGGLHAFMNWDRPILTDSGGYQVMSLAKLRTITEEGVAFQSHIDGSKHMLSPERSMEIQRRLGADIVMAFDECTPYPAPREEVEKSMKLSMRWARRSRKAFDAFKGGSPAALFGIVQGGMEEDLRKASIEALTGIGFEGYAVGGLAVGEGQQQMLQVLDFTMPHMPADAPRYLMGVGKPDDLVEAVWRGLDMFDCVLPTRSGRNGQAFTWDGTLNIRNARFRDDAGPLSADCTCRACRGYSRAYIHHLTKAQEMLGAMLLTEHNLTFYQDLMASMRAAISEGRLAAFRRDFHARYASAA